MKPRSPPCHNAESEFVSVAWAPRGRITGWTVLSRSIDFWRSCGRSFSEFNPDAQSKPPKATQFFQYRGYCVDGGADAPVRAGPPGPASPPTNSATSARSKPTGASAADPGVRPTIYAGFADLGRPSGIGRFRHERC